MSANTSSNISFPVLCYSDSTVYPEFFMCLERNSVGASLFLAYTATNLLILPLYFLVLWMGFCRRRREGSAASETTSHSDFITYNLVTMEIICVLGFLFSCSANFVCRPWMMITGYFLSAAIFPAQTLFHCLTCVERYMAVVHPIAYLKLGKSGRVRVRNISLVCVWLLNMGVSGVILLYFPRFPAVIYFSLNAIIIIIVSFCSISVLNRFWNVGGRRERIDRTKQRAYQNILFITGTLVMRSSGLAVTSTIFVLQSENENNQCVALICGNWLYLPSSLVLPLLFLHRAGALACFSRNTSTAENYMT
ncbi:Hypothetical protein SMAX5B_004453 [Scophthalmus maximus]|uniref:G-protein coupled receptors family 1 profile domain-containing protein n=2 Tax=Scophthalmus maximus TaxID=52904 RepID=A0A2U9B0B2_SCOMX|nr:Hypothetical protein SMAX5B_004453 [Scophthalmus maximus]KAF0028923.1 hypothetical protein F2P81_018028 [Scophthalmus maximus]